MALAQSGRLKASAMHSIGSSAMALRAPAPSVSPVNACITPRSCQTLMENDDEGSVRRVRTRPSRSLASPA